MGVTPERAVLTAATCVINQAAPWDEMATMPIIAGSISATPATITAVLMIAIPAMVIADSTTTTAALTSAMTGPSGARSAQFQRGNRIPMEYRHRQYAVNDWRPHHLSAPPRGHQWVQVGTDYALIAIATGIIAQLVLSR